MSFNPPSDINLDTPHPPPPADIPNDATGDEAYARRMRLSQRQQLQFQPPSPPSAPAPVAQITRAPVRYNLPSAPPEIPASEAELAAKLAEDDTLADAASDKDQQRSNRPG